MSKRGQSAMEWLMTHAWSIIIVLSVSAVLFYAGVFEVTGRPRFEGLDALAMRPVPDQVKLYSDGVLVLTVLNTRPYSVQMDYVEVAPIADKEDVIRTTLNAVVGEADYAVFEVNASNIYGSLSALFPVTYVSADDEGVDFHFCVSESYVVGGGSRQHTVCGKAWRIPFEDALSPTASDCSAPGCKCKVDGDCFLVCEACYYTGDPEQVFGDCDRIYGCDLESGIVGETLSCEVTAEHPEGECCTDPSGDTCYDDLI